MFAFRESCRRVSSTSTEKRVEMLGKGCTNTYLRPVSYFFLFLTMVVTMVSFCTSSWYSKMEFLTDSNATVVVYKGIWNVCKDKPDWMDKCVFLPDKNSILKFDFRGETLTSVRALYSMSMMLMIGALCYPPFYKNMSNGVVKIGIMSILTSVGGICTFVAMLIMTHAMHSLDEIPKFGYSYIAGWVSAGMSVFTASLLYIASKDNVYVEGLY